MSQDWTEKYRPQSIKDIFGNPSALETIMSWAKSWENGKPQKKALVLMGPPGIGKTTAAEALANDMGWGIVEMNASDQRTGDAIRAVALRGASSDTFSDTGEYLKASEGRKKLIVLDEADNLFGREDKGALPVISELIKETKQPVILIVNDFYALSRKSSTIKTGTIQVTFKKPVASTIAKVLKKIANEEDIEIGDVALKKISENANGDLRAAVRDFESVSMGKKVVTSEDLSSMSERVIQKSLYDLMNAVFRGGDASAARQLMKKIDETPDQVLLWIDENLPSEYTDHGDLVRGYEKLSRADIFLGRVHRRQYYGFWSYAGDMMTMGVATAKRSKNTSHERIKFPTYLMKMSRSKGVRALKKEICFKLAVLLHTSTFRVSNDVLPSLKIMIKNDAELRESLVKDAMLIEDELAMLLDDSVDSPAVKEIFGDKSTRSKKKAEVIVEEKPAEPEPVVDTKPVPPPKAQKNLFDF